MADKLSKVLGQEVRYNDVGPLPTGPSASAVRTELGNMFRFKRDFEAEYVGARDLDVARSLNRELQTFDAWLAQNPSRIPIE